MIVKGKKGLVAVKKQVRMKGGKLATITFWVNPQKGQKSDRPTTAKVNERIKKYGYEIVRDKSGYFWFSPQTIHGKDIDKRHPRPPLYASSVYTSNLTDFTISQWEKELKDLISEHRSRRDTDDFADIDHLLKTDPEKDGTRPKLATHEYDDKRSQLSKLQIKALRTFPNSPTQLKIRSEIDKLSDELQNAGEPLAWNPSMQYKK